MTVGKDQAKRLGLEKDLLRPSLSGEQIKRYQSWVSDQLILYTTKRTNIEAYPNARAFLESFKSQNTCMEVKHKQHPWWSLHRARDDSIFASPKIIGLTTTKSIELAFDESSNLFVTDAMYVFSPDPGVNPKALIGVMQSEAFAFLYRVANMGEARVIPQIKASKLLTLPIPDLRDNAEIVKLVEKMLTLHELHQKAKSDEQKEILDRQIDETDADIDRVVSNLYELSDEEISFVRAEQARHVQALPVRSGMR